MCLFSRYVLVLFILSGVSASAQVPGTQKESAPASTADLTRPDLPTVWAKGTSLKPTRFSVYLPASTSTRSHTELMPRNGDIIGDIGGAAVGKIFVKDLLQQFIDAANQILFSAQNTGNALLSQAGTELNVATQNIGIVLGKELDKTVAQLDRPERSLFAQLKNMVDAANSLPDQVARIVDLAQLDITQITNSIPFTKKRYFYISTVHGLTQIHQASDYKLSLTGLGFGYDDNNNSYQVSITIGRTVLAVTAFQRPDNHELDLTIPHDTMEPFFEDTKVGYVPLHLSSTITSKRIFLKPLVKTYDINLNLLTLPKNSATFILTEPVTGQPHLDGRTLVDSSEVTMNAGACHSDHPCDWSRDYKVADNQRIINVRYACVGQCGWCYNLRHGGYSIDYDILNDGTKATVYRHCDGDAEATTVTHYFDYQNQITDTNPYAHARQGIAFADSVSIDLSPQNTACTYEVAGRLITGQEIKEDANSALASAALLKASGMPLKFGDHCRVTFTLSIP